MFSLLLSAFIGGFVGASLMMLAKQKENKKEKVHRKTIKESNEFNIRKARIVKKHESDLTRIKELNKLSKNEEIFYRLLKRVIDLEIIVSENRFIMCNSKNQPVIIFILQDGNEDKSIYYEEGIPKVIYRGLPKEHEVQKDYAALMIV